MSLFQSVGAAVHGHFARLLIAALIALTVIIPIAGNARPAAAAGAYTTSTLNLRAGPSTSNYIKLTMPEGAYVDLLSDLGRSGFYKVNYNGELGYAYGDYLSVGGNGGNDDMVDAGWGDAGSAYTTSALNLRAGPSTNHDVVLVMPEGVAVQLTGSGDSGFSGVVYSGNSGWASNDYLTDDSGGGNGNGDTGTAYTTSSLNLRSGPGVSNSVILVMPGGAEVTLTGDEQGGFAGVRYNGTTGWASLSYLTDQPVADGGDNGDGIYTQDEIIAIIYAAADRYGQSREAMLAVARCESVLDPNAINYSSNASGLFQFLPGTWATTPYANQSIFDPVASANAAGWMWSVGRRGEWVC